MLSRLRIISLLVLFIAWYLTSFIPTPGRRIGTKSGEVEGIISKSRDGREFYEWLGIPYAQPPVGERRFASPEPFEYWEGVLDARSYNSPCASMHYIVTYITGSEDCLYLNIHAPKLKREPGKRGRPLLPVMIYIHGGAFMRGGANLYRPDYFMDEDVVLVTMNYRLGILGFLSTGDDIIRGNMGLKDQALAIRWIQNNIRAFGGDPNRITIFGESAGAASVHYHMLSWQTIGMFEKAALLSGAAGSPWSFISTERAAAKSQSIAKSLGCPFQDNLDVADCLKNKPVDELLEAVREDAQNIFLFLPHLKGEIFAPTVEAFNDEEAFLTQHPYKILEKGKFQKVPMLAGVMADEGLASTFSFFTNEDNMEIFEFNWTESIERVCLHSSRTAADDILAERLKKYYFFQRQKELSYGEKLPKYIEMFSDCLFNLHVSRAAEFQKKFANVYLFHFNIHGGPSMTNLLMHLGSTFHYYLDLAIYFVKSFLMTRILGISPTDYGVSHGDDLPYLFPIDLIPKIHSGHSHYKHSKRWVKFLVDFASANDTSTLKFGKMKLSPTSPTAGLTYLDVNLNKPALAPAPFQVRLDFLKSIGFR